MYVNKPVLMQNYDSCIPRYRLQQQNAKSFTT